MTSLATELLHFSERPLKRVHKPDAPQPMSVKPKGFWVSVGTEWMEWCVAEGFRLDTFKHVARVEIALNARILRLSGAADLDRFTKEYGTDRGYTSLRHYDIDWMRVATLYDGIIIAPYCWERRHELMWYYGWDVASGCIWNPKVVTRFEAIPLPTLKSVDE